MSKIPGVEASIKQQRGVALLVTLVILVAVTMIGLTALRAGLVHVAIATNSQAQTILFQSADASGVSLETLVNNNKSAAGQVTGVLGMLSPGIEKTGCLTALNGFVAPTNTTDRPCATGEFTNARGLVIAQTTLLMPVSADSGSGLKEGDDFSGTGGLIRYSAYSTAVMPAMGAANAADITNCLKNKADDSANVAVVTISECLANAGVPYTTLVQEYTSGLGEKAEIK